MGSISAYRTAKGEKRYRIIYRRPDHKQTSERGFKRKRDAELRLAEVEITKARGEYVTATEGRVTVRELGAVWLASKEGVLKPSSFSSLQASWKNYVEPKWGNRAIADIRHSEVQSWVSNIGMSSTVVARAYGILAGILDSAERDRRVANNVSRGISLPRKSLQKTRRYLTHRELWKVASAAGQHQVLVLTLGYCGLRWGELIGLQVSSIDFNKSRINVARNVVEVDGKFHEGTPKSHETRAVPVPAEVLERLRVRSTTRQPTDLVFDNGYGGYMKRVRASTGSKSWWKSALDDAGVDRMVLHDLRHTAASLAVSAGANVKAVQRMLGHASAAMTLDVYSDLFEDDLEALTKRLDQAIATQGVVNLLPEPRTQKARTPELR
ncbi:MULTISPECIES: site-specific integrase [Leucobacter]|uniref:Site-specific recombinase XerD n=1 Tax=Leucobacter chromiiresistens TaxID=1079994 RepID=A0A1H0YFT1_9MICO|nr:site-specific integrase [Leucobacter chromiiresistens]SDQ13893.1 Site-specific recombinase XerD [Leucobacter chromiiresistens]